MANSSSGNKAGSLILLGLIIGFIYGAVAGYASASILATSRGLSNDAVRYWASSVQCWAGGLGAFIGLLVFTNVSSSARLLMPIVGLGVAIVAGSVILS